MGNHGKSLDQTIAQLCDLRHVGVKIVHCLLKCSCHADDSSNILCTCTLAALLGAALDQRGNQQSLACIECANTLRSMELVSSERKHVAADILYVNRNMTDSLDGVSMEKDTVFVTDSSNLLDRLKGSDLIVRHHDGNQRSVRADSLSYRFRINSAFAVNRQQSYFESLLFKTLEGVKDCMMLDHIRNNMLFALSCANFRTGKQRLIISFAATTGEYDLLRVAVQAFSHSLTGTEKSLRSKLTNSVQGRGITVLFSQIRHHCVQRCFAELCRCSVVCIYCSHKFTILSLWI